MAGGGKERRMVFDIRGRRKHVVKAVYAVLAVLMGASLFLVVGPVNIGGLLGNSSGTSQAGKFSEEQAEKVERKLKKSPEDPQLLLSLTRARLAAGTSLRQINPETGEIAPTTESLVQYEKAVEAWAEYLKATDQPNVGVAQQVAQAQLTKVQAGGAPTELENAIKETADTLQLIIEHRPSLAAISQYATYRMFTFEPAAAEKALAEGKKLAKSKFDRENLENQFEEAKKSAAQFKKSLEAEKKANKASAKQRIENPLGGLGQ